tara:strand:- start:518 stop:1105 length:588 start_codon:yes stop_codon:yes gene_type:complete
MLGLGNILYKRKPARIKLIATGNSDFTGGDNDNSSLFEDFQTEGTFTKATNQTAPFQSDSGWLKIGPYDQNQTNPSGVKITLANLSTFFGAEVFGGDLFTVSMKIVFDNPGGASAGTNYQTTGVVPVNSAIGFGNSGEHSAAQNAVVTLSDYTPLTLPAKGNSRATITFGSSNLPQTGAVVYLKDISWELHRYVY